MRTWKCPECDGTTEISYDWLVSRGEPVCQSCDCDMELQPEQGSDGLGIMNHLNKRAEAIFAKLLEGMTKPCDHKKLDNAPGFMAVCVEIIAKTQQGDLVSVAHYAGPVNGDLLRDPDMVFLVDAEKHVYPLSFRQDSMGIDQEAATYTERGWQVRPKLQRDLAKFANQWMVNIASQQGI